MPIGWLHLTDAHFGQPNETLRASVEARFFEDLAQRRSEFGVSIDFVVLTGDVAFSGLPREYEDASRFLERLRSELGSSAKTPLPVLVVPGNHDLRKQVDRSLPDLPKIWLRDPDALFSGRREMRNYEKAIARAFSSYKKWSGPMSEQLPEFRTGKLPGDFSCVISKGSTRLGIVGLNSAFLGIAGQRTYGKLGIARSQLDSACGEPIEKWSEKVQSWLLLTHHPLEWLTRTARNVLGEAQQSAKMGWHLCGHLHVPVNTFEPTAGNRFLQGRSIFGVQDYTDKTGNIRQDRTHGYCLGVLEAPKQATSCRVRFYPRYLVRKQNQERHFARDLYLTRADDSQTETFSVLGSLGTQSPPHPSPGGGHYVESDLQQVHNGMSYAELRKQLDSLLPAKPSPDENILAKPVLFYLAAAPFETATSEHLLIVLRRRVCSCAAELDDRGARTFISSLLEPALVHEVMTECKTRGWTPLSPGRIRYQIARLIAEMGDFHAALGLYDIVCGHQSIDDAELRIMAANGEALAWQNLGIFERACPILERLLEEVRNPDKKDLAYFTLKHYATLLRRINTEGSNEAMRLLDEAAQYHETYHISYSRGFIYLLEGQHESARTEFLRCLELLGKHDQEYYFIHLPYALSLLAQPDNRRDWPEIKRRLVTYEESLRKYGNFKRDLGVFVHKLARPLCGGVLNAAVLVDELRRSLPELLDTEEKIVALRADAKILAPHYRDPARESVMNEIQNQLLTATTRFKRLEQAVEVVPTEARAALEEHPEGVLVMLRVSGWAPPPPLTIATALPMLGQLIRTYFANDLDEVSFRGSGFLLAKSLPREAPTDTSPAARFLQTFLRKIQLLDHDLREKLDPPFGLGVGVARGEYAVITVGHQRLIVGRGASVAARMARHAVPGGVVIRAGDGMPDLSRNLDALMPLRRAHFAGDDVYCSSDVMHAPSLGYFTQHDPEERRLFVSFGRPCQRKCVYCMSRNIHTSVCDLDETRFRAELETLLGHRSLEGYLFSLGYLNEPLDQNNLELAETAVRILAENTGAAIQLATKAGPKRIRTFLNDLNEAKVDLGRLTVLWSLSTVDHAAWIEPQRPEFESEDRDGIVGLADEYQGLLVPYLKPFLPGISDTDSGLLAFLRQFKEVVVGYPYLSRTVMRDLSERCIEHGMFEALPHYSYTDCVLRSQERLNLAIPCVSSNEYHPVDYQRELEKFVGKIGDKPTVFISSPCAVAWRQHTTSYTSVGRKDKAFRSILCRGNVDCPNVYCIYNSKHPTVEPRWMSCAVGELRQQDHTMRDRSHSFDHFVRVRDIALQLLERHRHWLQQRGLASAFSTDDQEALELSCLVHDLGDPKLSAALFRKEERDSRDECAARFLDTIDNVQPALKDKVRRIIVRYSFDDFVNNRGTREEILGGDPASLQGEALAGRLLFDADIIDAIGAMGIARCFSFPKNAGIFSPGETPRPFDGMAEQRSYTSAVTHFLEKLVQLHQLMLPASQEFARSRHEHVVDYLCRFFHEFSAGMDEQERARLRKNLIPFLALKTTFLDEDSRERLRSAVDAAAGPAAATSKLGE